MDLLKTASGNQWKKIGVSSHHGINIPLSAIHTQTSSGIGEFLDLFPLIDWCKSIGMDVIQILPINDSGYDPSPYNALSSCALNPIYLSLHSLPLLDEYPRLKEELSAFSVLNQTPRINYKEVLEKKTAWLRCYFEKTSSAHIKQPGFLKFLEENPWVESYALFKTLKSRQNEESWMDWPFELRAPETKEYQLLVKEEWEELCFHILLQYLAFLQMRSVQEHAKNSGVLLMGDIPILISPNSADVWHKPDLFDLSVQAGAPPDFYISEGQNWGFPLFNWGAMKHERYSWWKQRLTYASHFFDLYRIDHAVGFFRIWGISKGTLPKDGSFYPEDESLWEIQGKMLLEMLLKSSLMLPIAEDLGVVPDITRSTLLELGICGTKVIRWERYWKEDARFVSIEDYPVISLTTVSTHDSETLSLWWKNSIQEAKAYAQSKHWEYTQELTSEQRRQILWDSHHTPSLFHINLLPEYLAYFPDLISSNPEEERINIPGKILSSNWTYRMKPSIEELFNHSQLNRFMREIHA